MVLRMDREFIDADARGRVAVRASGIPHEEQTKMRLSMVMRAVLVTAVAAAIAVPVPAHAQFGKMLKKAKAKVVGDKDSTAAASAESATASSGSLRPGTPKFDATMIELTPSVVDRMLRGMAAEARVAQASSAREARINADVAALEKESDQLEAEHPSSERSAWQDANYKIEECIGDELQKRQEQNEGEMQARLMGDPVARQKMMELTQKMSAEMQRGDSVAAKKTMADVQALTYPSMKADSAAAMKTCGTPAAKPAWMLREEALGERRSKLADELRDAGSAARDTALVVVANGGGGAGGGAGGSAGGAAHISAAQYGLALERMIAWAAATGPGGKAGKGSYSATELEALKARDADVRRLTADMRAHNIWR